MTDELMQMLLRYLSDMADRGDHTAQNLLKDLQEFKVYLDTDIAE